FLMYPRFLQTILGIETSSTRQYHVFKLSSKLFANMKLNFEGQPIPLLADMLSQAQAGEGAGHGQSLDPNIASFLRAHKTDDEPFTSTNVEDESLGGSFHESPPRSTQAPPVGHTSGGAEDLITLTVVSSVVSTLVQKVNLLETELKDTKKLFKDVVVVSDSDQEEGGEQDVDLDALLALANVAVIVDSNIPPSGASRSHIPTDVPTSVAPAGVSNKGKTPMQIEDMIDLVEANASLSKTLLGDDVNEDNFLVRIAALIKRKK
ncbi:hypothetical protein Tco_1580333, partial [Tanacetum coccineum]